MTIIRVGLDTSKHVFQLHGVDENEQPVLRRQIQRSEVEKFFAKLPSTRIGIEACGASHHKLKAIEARLMAWHRQDQTSQCLATIPGVGPIGGVSFALKVADPGVFRSGRRFAAWIGITPREDSTAGRQKLGRISRAGDEDLRRLLVIGATAVIRAAKPGRTSPWLLALLARKPKKLVAVALANKMARIVWAMMVSGETYRRPAQA